VLRITRSRFLVAALLGMTELDAPSPPMNYAFLIDNRKCIGCHACSTACKAENEVPLGVNRTWVKYVEKGVFPHTRRYFQVTRCNHCDRPPCVPICPTTAMYRRSDGIVEFDSQRCIGCKACLQACPYDAIHIDPESGTAAKCHFCAHRTDVGLEPACVIVCPVHAIIAGDLEDSESEITRLLSTQTVAVRKPEQGTRPKLFYVEAEESAISPGFATPQSSQLWAEAPAWGPSDWRGPIQIAPGRMADAMLRSSPGAGGPQGPPRGVAPRETYNPPHRIPWHWQVPAYLVTKALGAGIFLVAAAGVALGLLPAAPLFMKVAPLAALLFIALTGALLVGDLDRPERFWTILTRPQWRSWLTRGAFLLLAYGMLLSVAALAQLLGRADVAAALAWPGVALAALSAVYTAFLFAQAEGRDLWQSPLLSAHLLVQAILAGAAGLLLLGLFTDLPAQALRALAWCLGLSIAGNLALTAGGEFAVPHANAVASAARMITRGRYAPQYWGSLLAGGALPLLLTIAFPTSVPVLTFAGVLALAGLFAYEWAFVFAPQQIPNS
jgi:Fe-S-cluster-containing dehydrogenase component/formate-dependent nitrite reductase membrane component NrfD